MKLIDKIKNVFKGKESKINIRGEVSEGKWAQIVMTNLFGERIWDGTPIEHLKIRAQVLNYDGNKFSEGDYRIDNNSNEPLHEHLEHMKFPIMGDKVASHALARIFGNDCWALN